MGATAALKLRRVAENLEIILSLEALCAAQGIEFRRRALGRDRKLGTGTRKLYEAIRSRVPFIESDEYMKVHLDSALAVVQDFYATSESN